jgi:hypothetical protein
MRNVETQENECLFYLDMLGSGQVLTTTSATMQTQASARLGFLHFNKDSLSTCVASTVLNLKIIAVSDIWALAHLGHGVDQHWGLPFLCVTC